MFNSSGLLERFVDLLIVPAIKIVVAAGFFLFVWGFVSYFYNLSQGESTSEGKSHMLWGVLGLLIMVSVGGILGLIINTFGINYNDIGRLPN
jgi:fructose-specific phosphotransferase system IIC component